MEKKGVLSNLKFIFSTTFLLVLMFCAVVVTVLNTYKPTLRVTLNDKFIGYFASEEEFEKVYVTLLVEQEQKDPNVKVYLDAEPEFTEAYIRDSLLSSQNVYTNLRAEIKTEYTIYNVLVKDEKKMTFNNQDEANKFLSELKKELPKVKCEVSVEKTESLGEMTTLDLANNIFKDIVSRNKPVVKPPVVIRASSTNARASWELANVAAAQGGIWPTVERRINAHFGTYMFGNHTGIDIGGKVGTPIYAYKSGLVTFAGSDGNYGLIVRIDHGNGVGTYYAHCKQLFVKAGDTVQMGQSIAQIGLTGFTTGSHLHFELRINNVPVNPYGYIAGK